MVWIAKMNAEKQQHLARRIVGETLEDLRSVITIACEKTKTRKSVNAQNSEGLTALMIASIFGNLAKVQQAVERKADMDVVNREGNSAIMLAAWNGHYDIVRFLDKAGADIKILNRQGQNITDLILESHLEMDGIALECASTKRPLPEDSGASGHFPKKSFRQMVVKELNKKLGYDILRAPPHC